MLGTHLGTLRFTSELGEGGGGIGLIVKCSTNLVSSFIRR